MLLRWVRAMAFWLWPLLGPARLAAPILLAAALPVTGCTLPPHSVSQMPDAVSAPWPGAPGILAWYDGPTTRYAHGVLGDAIEATELHLYTDTSSSSCGNQSITLPQELVFEDVAPRLADLDSDGRPEVMVVQSHQRLGAQLAIYRAAADGESLDLVAATPFIGRSNRWLAPIGAADFDGDGTMDVAYIDRPHLARTLRVWRFEGDTLTQIAALEGLTNHRIGEPFITGGVRDCGDGPELIVADRNWTRVMAVSMQGDTLDARPIAPFSQGAVAEALDCAL